MFTRKFWKSAAERAVKTAAQSTLGVIATVQAAIVMGGPEVASALDGKQLQLYALGVGLSTLASVCTSLVGAGIADKGTPSFVEGGE